MEKAIMLSIRPKWCFKIMNGEKTIEIRKKFPKDYRGWVYIYCTKEYHLWYDKTIGKFVYGMRYDAPNLNGKVVARFWCDKVEEINKIKDTIRYWCEWKNHYCGVLSEGYFEEASCLSMKEIEEYTKGKHFYAIHITKLEIFDEPKEISEFYGYTKRYKVFSDLLLPVKLTKAPQNYCYVVEGE